MSTSQSDKPHKVVCHAPGPRCLGCDHYKGLIAECVYAIPPSAETDAWPTKNDYLIVCAALGNATNAWAALVKHIGNDVIPGSAFEALIRDMNVALDDSRPFVQSATPTAAPHDEGHEEQQVDTGRAVAAPSALAKRIREECKSVLYMNAPNLVDLALLAADALESRLLDTMPLSPKSENSRDNAESRQIGDSIPTAARCVIGEPVAWRHSTPHGWVVTKTKHMDSEPLYAAPVAAPSGGVSVPIIPTSAMMHAGYEAAAFPRDPEIVVAMWKAMLAAAPVAADTKRTKLAEELRITFDNWAECLPTLRVSTLRDVVNRAADVLSGERPDSHKEVHHV